MRLIFFGNPEFAVPSLERLASSHDVACVVTSPDRPAGRGRKLRIPDVKSAAERLGLPVLQVEDLKDSSFLAEIARYAALLFVVVAFRILPPELFTIPQLGAINLHASLLPRYRGAAPINRAIMAGETETGVTTFLIRKKVDTGGILLQRSEVILPDDTFGSLHDRLSVIGADVLVETVNGLESGTLKPVPQDSTFASKAPKLSPEDGRIDWGRPAEDIRNQIRGLCPVPCAYTYRDGKKLKVFNSEIVSATLKDHNPGEIMLNGDNSGFVVACGKDLLRILELQPAGRKRMNASDYLRGYPVRPGEKLG